MNAPRKKCSHYEKIMYTCTVSTIFPLSDEWLNEALEKSDDIKKMLTEQRILKIHISDPLISRLKKYNKSANQEEEEEEEEVEEEEEEEGGGDEEAEQLEEKHEQQVEEALDQQVEDALDQQVDEDVTKKTSNEMEKESEAEEG